MTLAELITKEKELCSELITVREEIIKMKQQKTITLLEEAIKCLNYVDNMHFNNLNCLFEFDCEKCEMTTTTAISLEEICIALKELKENIV